MLFYMKKQYDDHDEDTNDDNDDPLKLFSVFNSL